MAIIIFFIIPMILKATTGVDLDSRLVCLSGAFHVLVYGWNLKTHSAVLGMLLALCLTGVLSALFINIARLTGYGDENAIYLVQMAQANIDLRGLLLGGMIIGSLGVLDTWSSAGFGRF
jgi:uncharacterized membrane protein